MHLKLYRLLSTLAGPLIDLYLRYRKKIGKEDPKRFNERLGHASFPRPSGSLIWVHAASIGEVISVLPMIQKIIAKYSDINVLITTGTVTSAKMLENKMPDRTFHQYVPIDRLITVNRFLDHWKPDLALWTESELWPNMIIETNRRGCTMIQVNGRISVNSFEKWARYSAMAENILSCFSLSLAQSEEDRERLERLGAKNAKYIGNLKYDAPPLPSDPAETGKLLNMIGERHLWLATSTQPGEEKIILEVHKTLKKHHSDLLTIIAPRHPERGADIAKMLQNSNMKTSLRSLGDGINSDSDFYIADTIGELGIFYRLTGIAFIAGSLVEHGGQNPLEAARLECALITGPYTDNFTKVYNDLEKEKAVIRVRNKEALTEKLNELLSNHELQEEYANTALNFIENKVGVIDSYIENLSPYLKPLSKITTDENS